MCVCVCMCIHTCGGDSQQRWEELSTPFLLTDFPTSDHLHYQMWVEKCVCKDNVYFCPGGPVNHQATMGNMLYT